MALFRNHIIALLVIFNVLLLLTLLGIHNGYSIKYELDCTVSDFTNKYNALLLKDESLTWYYNYENKKTKIADLSADTTGVWDVEISLPEERIVAIFSLTEKGGKTILSFDRIKQWYLNWNIGGNQGRSSRVLDGAYMFISDVIRISNTFERSFLDKLCNYKSPRKAIDIIINFWLFYSIPITAGYAFIVLFYLFFIKRKFRNLGTLSILLMLISFFPVFIYKSAEIVLPEYAPRPSASACPFFARTV